MISFLCNKTYACPYENANRVRLYQNENLKTEIRVLPSIPAPTNNFTFDAIHTDRRDRIIVICQRRHVF